MKSGFSVNRGLWVGVILLSLFLIGIQNIDVFGVKNPEKYKIGFLEFLDRHYLAFKQSLHQASAKPSQNVQILRLNYHNDIEFWFDDAQRRNLAEKLLAYPGPIAASLDPVRLRNDPALKALLDKPNFIRPYVSTTASLDEVGEARRLEEWAGRSIEQAQTSLYGKNLKLVPSVEDYYQEAPALGALQFAQDSSTQFIYEFPVVIDAANNKVPSLLLDSLRLFYGCQAYQYSFATGLLNLRGCSVNDSLKSKILQLPHPMPLFFYEDPFREVKLDDLQPSNDLLIVDITDPTKVLQTFTGERETWATILATAFSNRESGPLWYQPPLAKFIEFLIFVLATLLLAYTTQRFRPRGVITASILVTVLYFVIDLVLPFRLSPIEEGLSIALVAFVAISSRAIQDFEERSLIERAFSGYVSQERLKRLLSGKEELDFNGRLTHLTTFMIDIVKFSKLSQDMPTQEVFKMIQGVFEQVDPIIFRRGGYIDKKMGDGMLCFFGDELGETNPQDAALSAVKGALEIQKLDLKFDGKPIEFRIGINSGELLVGNTGSKQHFNYTVLGDAVNLTQRLEAACPTGGVLVGEETALLIEDHFEMTPLEISVKNESQKLSAFLINS